VSERTYYSSRGTRCEVCDGAVHRYRVTDRGRVDAFCCSCRTRFTFFLPRESRMTAEAAAVALANLLHSTPERASGSSLPPLPPPDTLGPRVGAHRVDDRDLDAVALPRVAVAGGK
jgi:hypothetical protein